MESKNKITKQEILDSISRSGYLLESEITKSLINKGFFVESNIATLDPLTGKSREIDLSAEYHYDFLDKVNKYVVALTRYIFEIKNNSFPLVLLTNFENSPNFAIWEGLKTYQTIPPAIKDTYFKSYYDFLIGNNEHKMFTQFCSFSKKKNEELMAHHPEIVYSSLLKLATYCEEMAEEKNTKPKNVKEKYFRNFLYLPILLINDDLYELELSDNNKAQLHKVNSSKLVFNYHYKQKPCTSIIYIITKAGLDLLLDEVFKAEILVEKEMIETIQFTA